MGFEGERGDGYAPPPLVASTEKLKQTGGGTQAATWEGTCTAGWPSVFPSWNPTQPETIVHLLCRQ